MATASVPNDHSALGPNSDAGEINANYAALVAFANGSVLHRDGSKVLTARLSLAASDPTISGHAVRRAYVQGAYLEAFCTLPQVIAANTDATVIFDTVITDDDGSYSTTEGTFAVQRSGVYLVAWAFVPPAGETHLTRTGITVGGTAYAGPQLLPSSMGSETPNFTMCLPVRAEVGDVIFPTCRFIAADITATVGAWLTIAWLHG